MDAAERINLTVLLLPCPSIRLANLYINFFEKLKNEDDFEFFPFDHKSITHFSNEQLYFVFNAGDDTVYQQDWHYTRFTHYLVYEWLKNLSSDL